MKWARNIVGGASLSALLLWVLSATTTGYQMSSHGLCGGTVRAEFGIGYKKSLRDRGYEAMQVYRPGPEKWLTLPRCEITPGVYVLFVPHWLTNLIAWSLFIVLWRRTRKPPKGHCQSCGYDLTGNVSGQCPECNAATAPSTERQQRHARREQES